MMASSMLTSERRWTSTRKSGMTVLGKVPKPINLPSQKMENHGLDPNVEIVPKGALSWGTRPSLASSSAWGSSNLSPRADGGIGSSIHGNGRPLSGGSGTRPSTGSSERSSEPLAVSWGPSSRPSSASGVVPTSHLVTANRPRSAETRPNSSPLSRFAEGSADNITWGAAGTSEKMAAEAPKRSDFTLTSGDFPTLGSEKVDEPKLQGQSPRHIVPGSGLPSSLEGTLKPQLNSGCGNSGPLVHGNFNSWNADSISHAAEDTSSRTENWHNDNHNSQPLLDANMPARHFASWHGPGHSPNVVLYGGHEAGGPYRPFGTQGSYHVDPYYPYVPAGPLPNAQAFSRPEAIPGGMHFNERESYRHMPPESYIAYSQTSIPVRPGVYQGPVLFESFHGPPQAGFNNSSEQEVSTMGMPGQHAFNSQHLPDNSRLQPWRFYTQPDGSVSVTQQQIIDQANEPQGRYKVLLKQHGNQEEERTVSVYPTVQRGKLPGFSTPETDLVNCHKQEQTTDKQHIEDSLSEHSNDSVDFSNRNSLGISKSTGHSFMKKLDTASAPISDQKNTSLKKNVNLMEKVEGLNCKTRAVDAQFEGEIFPSKEKMKSNRNSKNNADQFDNVGPKGYCSASNTSISDPRNLSTSRLNTSTKVIVHESVTELNPSSQQLDELAVVTEKPNYSEDVGHLKFHNQKRIRNMKGGADHHYGKLKFGSYGADGMNDTPDGGSSMAAGKGRYLSSVHGSHASQRISEGEDSQLVFKSVNEQSPLVSVDDAQHAKLKEAARQRAVELQKKELERTAEQKAKALARLDELNRRTSAGSKQNSRPPSSDVLHKQDTTSSKDAKSSAIVNETHVSLPCNFPEKSKENDECVGDLPVSSHIESSRTSGSSVQACPSEGEQTSPSGRRTTPEVNTERTTSYSQDGVVSRRKQAGYRRRHNTTDEHNSSERKANSDDSGNPRSASIFIEDSSDGLGNLSSGDSFFRPSSKNSHGSRCKSTRPSSPLPSLPFLDGVSEKKILEHNETNPVVNLVEQMPERNSDEIMGGQCSSDLEVAPNQEGSGQCKVTSGAASNNWKPHPHRKQTRNLYSDKANAKYPASDTVVWAPVKPGNKNGSSEQTHKNGACQVTNLPDGKNGQDVHNGAKARRAEMERYVPKPVAKELSLQGDSQHSSPPFIPASFVTGRDVSSSIQKNITSTNMEDTRQNRQGKPRVSWRQRTSFEHERNKVEANISFESSKSPSELQNCDDLHVDCGNAVLEETMVAPLDIVKNHGASRQRRQQYKECRLDRSSYASTHGRAKQGEMSQKREMQSPVPAESGERSHLRNEKQSVGSGQVRSHWQPKPQVNPEHHLRGYKGSGGLSAPDQPLPSQTMVNEADDSNHQEGYSERRVMADEGKQQGIARGGKLMKQHLKDENEPFKGATYGRSRKAQSMLDRRNVERNIEYQTGFDDKGGGMFPQNSGSSEGSESHRFSSGASYGMQGRNHSRRGGPFYGPHLSPAGL